MSVKYSFCRTCEATCGLEVDVENNRVVKIRPDQAHVVSKGYSCVKGIHFDKVQNSPDRVTAPLKRAGEHHFIRPDTDLYFLAAFCRELISQQGIDETAIKRYMDGFPALKEAVASWTPERQSEVSGIPAETLRELVAAHRAARGACLYMATGVNQGRSGTLCFWLLEAINAISGNLDCPGGMLMGEGQFDMARQVKEEQQLTTRVDREDELVSIVGLQPSGMLSEDIESGRVHGMIVEASNPLLACSNPDGRLDRAFASLDLLVCIDLFRNEVGNLADYILPAPTWLEKGGNFLGTDRVLTDNGKVQLAPDAYVQTFTEKAQALFAEEVARLHEFKLIGKREIKRMNSASANVPRLVKQQTNYAYINSEDARELGVCTGDVVSVRSAFDSIRIPVKVSDEMMPRTVAIPQCWGHKDADGLSHAQRHPGVNSNYLAGDGPDNIEKLSGMSHLSGIFVEIERATE